MANDGSLSKAAASQRGPNKEDLHRPSSTAAQTPTRPAHRDAPVLLHACKAFAIFSIKPSRSPRHVVEEVVQLTTLRQCGSSSSLQSLDSSSALLYRSPAPALCGTSPTCPVSPVPATLSQQGTAIRLRSQSDCAVGVSPIKGILKRRSMGRSWSECGSADAAASYVMTSSVNAAGSDEMLLLDRCQVDTLNNRVVPRFDCCAFAGDDCCDCNVAQQITQPANGAKKCVTFSERVEQNIFRPGSSILGQRKKNQRKASAKGRKRRESGESSSSNNCNPLDNIDEDNCDEDDGDDRDDPQDPLAIETAAPRSDRSPQPQQGPEDSDDKDRRSVKAGGRRSDEFHQRKSTEKPPPTQQEKSLEQLSEKYKGFVVAAFKSSESSSNTAKQQLGRPSSVDSALGVEIGDTEFSDTSAIAAARTGTSALRKDSGVGDDDDDEEDDDDGDVTSDDEDMRDLCMRVCDAVVSG